MPAVKSCRAFELDALRGLALLMMVLHHFIFDLRYLLGLDVFAFQETWWFANLLRPAFLNVFLVVSGICCTFSRSNTRRGARLLAVALAFTAVTTLVSRLTGQEFYILFNVLHVLAFGTLLYAGLTYSERVKTQTGQERVTADDRQESSAQNNPGQKNPAVDVLLIVIAAVLIYLGSLMPHWQDAGSWLLLPIGLPPVPGVAMADYLPIIPWLGFFLVGALIGRIAYSDRCSAFPNAPRLVLQLSRPLEFMGRHSLVVYAVHQPVLLAILFGLRALGVL